MIKLEILPWNTVPSYVHKQNYGHFYYILIIMYMYERKVAILFCIPIIADRNV